MSETTQLNLTKIISFLEKKRQELLNLRRDNEGWHKLTEDTQKAILADISRLHRIVELLRRVKV